MILVGEMATFVNTDADSFSVELPTTGRFKAIRREQMADLDQSLDQVSTIILEPALRIHTHLWYIE